MFHHALNLLTTAWRILLNALSTSTLSIVAFSFVLPLLTFIISIVRKRDRPAMTMQAIRESIRPTLVSIGAVVVLLSLLFGGFLIYALYQDHQLLVSTKNAFRDTNLAYARQDDELRKENDKLKRENTRLTGLLAPDELQKMREAVTGLLEESKTVLDKCRYGPSNPCLATRATWEHHVETALKSYRTNPTLTARWTTVVAQNHNYGAPWVEVENEQRMLDTIAAELR